MRQIFPIHEVEAILDIPLNRMGCEDLRIGREVQIACILLN